MNINKRNLFYKNRMAIAKISDERNADAGVATMMWAEETGADYSPAELEEWKRIMVYYQRHKTLTLADLFQ